MPQIAAEIWGRMTGHLLLLDASGFAYRSHYAANPVYRAIDGQPIGATLGFIRLLWNLLGAAQADPPTHGAAVFDAPGPTFRHRLDPQYKANRVPSRKIELADQWALMRHAAETLGIKPLDAPGYEADDILATLAVRAKRAGMRTTIVAVDKDLLQTVEDGVIEVYNPVDRKRVLAADVEAKMGVEPKMVPHLQALWGDAIDNVIGVNGVGKDIAARLVRRYGSVEGVIANAKDIRWAPIRHQMVKKSVQERVRFNLKLVTLRCNVKLPVGPADLALEPIMKPHLVEFLRVLGASHHMEAIFGLDPQIARPVPSVALSGHMAWWTEELAHPGQTVPELPQCGFYRRKLVKGGPWVAGRIWREPEVSALTGQLTGHDVLRCLLGGKPKDPLAEWVRLSMGPIPQKEYDFLLAQAAHAKKWAPDSPPARPGAAIDIMKQPNPTNPRRRSP